jgi:predicted small lipoprotein YifL
VDTFGSDRLWKLAALASIGVALTLSGCGRKGPLELPPSAQTPQNTNTRAAENATTDPLVALGGSAQSGQKKEKKPEAFDSKGQPTAPAKTNRTSILDGMLD